MGPDLSKAPVKAGEIVAGKYRVDHLLGVGGMGVVVAARHLALDEPVALKFITDERATDRDARGRMMREARATFRLRSPHTVRVFDIGELPSGPLFIVMELLEGRDLKAELAARRRLPESEVARYAVEACDALEEAHAMGIVHRDLKPHNMFLARSARGATVLKILDFGMSKVDRELFEEGPMTKPATALGTPRYMAPEQWKSAAEVDARADVWALGVVMYELLTGAPPLAELRGAERMARIAAGAIEGPHEKFSDVGEAISRVVMKCLRPDPKVRWPSVKHLATALLDIFPDVDPRAERADVSTTGVTLTVPAEDMKRRAAATAQSPSPFERAPAAPPPAAADARPTAKRARPTLPDTPVALQGAPSSSSASDEFEARTEVRGPLITPAEFVATDLPSPAIERQPARAGAKTLRSAVDAGQLEKILRPAVPIEPTLKMQPGPARELLAKAEAEAARARALEAAMPYGDDGPPSAPIELLRPRPPRPIAVSAAPEAPRALEPVRRVPAKAKGPRVAILVVAGGILSVCALLAIGWFVAEALAK